MNLRRTARASLIFGIVFGGGCSPSTQTIETHRHTGADVDIGDLVSHTIAYKGKTMTLVVKVDESIPRGQGRSLRDFAGRDAKFMAIGTKGEQVKFSVRIPQGLDIPEAFQSDELRLTFVCTKGSLRDGNEAKKIESP